MQDRSQPKHRSHWDSFDWQAHVECNCIISSQFEWKVRGKYLNLISVLFSSGGLEFLVLCLLLNACEVVLGISYWKWLPNTVTCQIHSSHISGSSRCPPWEGSPSSTCFPPCTTRDKSLATLLRTHTRPASTFLHFACKLTRSELMEMLTVPRATHDSLDSLKALKRSLKTPQRLKDPGRVFLAAGERRCKIMTIIISASILFQMLCYPLCTCTIRSLLKGRIITNGALSSGDGH